MHLSEGGERWRMVGVLEECSIMMMDSLYMVWFSAWFWGVGGLACLLGRWTRVIPLEK
jgi:hypothetical protein